MLETIVYRALLVVVILGVFLPLLGNPKTLKNIKLRFRLHSTVFLLFSFFLILQIIGGQQPISYILGCIVILVLMLQSLIWTLFDIIKAYAKEEESAESNK